jgi:flagellin-like protein
MKFSRRRAVSPIIASLLLIAIAVAAGIIVYVYVNSLAGNLTGSSGNQVAQQIQLQAYKFTSVSGTGPSSTNVVVDVFLENVGSSSVTISAIYFDGTALTEWFTNAGPPIAYDEVLQVDGSGGNCFAAIPGNVLITGSASASAATSGNGSLCGTVGAAQNCSAGHAICVDTGATAANQAETLTLSAQSTNQIVIGLNAAATSGTSHTVKIVTANGGQAVFSVVAGRSG